MYVTRERDDVRRYLADDKENEPTRAEVIGL